jgi:hypothetical protein
MFEQRSALGLTVPLIMQMTADEVRHQRAAHQRRSITGACRCAGRVGMMATNDAIMRASSRSFLARVPLALANCRSLNGLIWRTNMPAASKARTTPRS